MKQSIYTGPIIDAHMHLWDLANGYEWLTHPQPDFERLLGNYDRLRRNFLVPDYASRTSGWKVVKSVHVQAFGFPGDPVAETHWLQQQADRFGYPHGIVAYVDLSDARVEETLRGHCAHANVRGVRMPLNYDAAPWRRMADRGDYMRDTQWRKGFALLAAHGLSFDMQIYHHQAPDAVALARDFSDTAIVVEHLVWPTDPSANFEIWRRHLEALAECPNVFLKVSGIGVVFGRSAPDLIRRYLRRAVATFGPERCLFGSNCPPDTLCYDFETLIGAYLEAFSDLSPQAHHDLFCGTAQRVYRL
jgi:predicted TIM-barrel fold metal-dependent hydrolase